MVTLKESVSSKAYLLSDGKFLYLLTKKPKNGSDKTKDKVSKYIYLVYLQGIQREGKFN